MNSNLYVVLAMAFALGLALRAGSVCLVAATEALLRRRNPDRMLLILEGTGWALVALVALGAYPIGMNFSQPVLIGLAGAFIFGVGAAVNGACAFGVIAQIGTGRFEYFLTGLGLWIGMQGVAIWRPEAAAVQSGPVLPWSLALWAIAALFLTRLVLLHLRGTVNLRRAVTGSVAIAVAAACFASLAILHREFPWITLLADLSMVDVLSVVIAVLVVAGAITAGLLIPDGFELRWPGWRRLGKRFAGGFLMGLGSILLPGGNDTLLFFGLTTGAGLAALGLLAVMAGIAVTSLISGRRLSPFLRRAAEICGLGERP
ncbi:YeeE/YedE thiosulfate transporter family protein [Roseovarius sp. C7]|uniref:YeeE/YedE thiosulfate transporter family protein n=1 Tax=Roseovarius sp. C7 TaxID=3398643 RepID=UPI0039F67E0C